MSPKKLVYIVEDSAVQRKKLENILIDIFDVQSFVDGKKASLAIQVKVPSLVIADVNMPNMDGFELCHYIKSTLNLINLPIILVTELSDLKDIITSLEVKADAFVSKPYDSKILVERILSTIQNVKNRNPQDPLERLNINYQGENHSLSSSLDRVTDLLFSTYENAVTHNKLLIKSNNELQESKEKIVQNNLELEKLNKEKNVFLSMAAHDLRNPLSVVTEASLLGNDLFKAKIPKELSELLDQIHHNSMYMLSLVNDLLDVAIIESGKVDLDLKETSLSDVLEKIAKQNRVIGSKKSITIETISEKNLPKIFLDIHKIESVLNNLLSNAIKYSNPNTKVFCSLKSEKNLLVLEIRDQGKGIKKEKLRALFEPFEECEKLGTLGERGTGLGLAIVKKLLCEHHAQIIADSKINEGTVFRIFFNRDFGKEERVA